MFICTPQLSRVQVACAASYATALNPVLCCAVILQVKYMVDCSTSTGTCAVCIVGGERSLVANLAAANNFKVGSSSAATATAAVGVCCLGGVGYWVMPPGDQ